MFRIFLDTIVIFPSLSVKTVRGNVEVEWKVIRQTYRKVKVSIQGPTGWILIITGSRFYTKINKENRNDTN